MNSIWAVVPAAGSGRRLGGEIPKQYREIAGAPLMEHTLRALLESPDIRGIVVALDPSDRRADAHSVMAGLELLATQGSEDDWVLVHDAARPCLPLDYLTALIEQARQSGEGVILAEPVADTLKQVDEGGRISGTVDRQSLWRAQTPQLFPLFALRAALGRCLEEGISVTDEAMAMERAGEPVHVEEGPSSNIKVTVEADLAFADLVLRKRGGQ